MLVPTPGGRRNKPVIGAIKARWPLSHRVQQLRQYGLDNSIQITREENMSKQNVSTKRGWTVVLAGNGINLALVILYTWSIFKGAIAESIAAGGTGAFTWDKPTLGIKRSPSAIRTSTAPGI